MSEVYLPMVWYSNLRTHIRLVGFPIALKYVHPLLQTKSEIEALWQGFGDTRSRSCASDLYAVLREHASNLEPLVGLSIFVMNAGGTILGAGFRTLRMWNMLVLLPACGQWRAYPLVREPDLRALEFLHE